MVGICSTIQKRAKRTSDTKVETTKDFCLFSRYYEAVIDEVTTDGQVSVTFANYSNLGVTTLGLLKLPAAPGSEAAGGSNVGTSLASKKEQLLKQKEYLKKRKQKKQDRFKKMELVILYMRFIVILHQLIHC